LRIYRAIKDPAEASATCPDDAAVNRADVSKIDVKFVSGTERNLRIRHEAAA